jgi:3-oxoadipate enol-lactonase
MAFLDLDGVRLHYAISGAGAISGEGAISGKRASSGDGPAVVLVHGALCSSEDWRPQTRRLDDRFRVISPDLRGHGRSIAPYESCTIEQFAADLNELVAALGAAPAVFVGHSLGARVVIEAAATCPREVSGLVLVDGSRMFGPDALPPGERVTEQSDAQVAALMLGTIDEAVGPFASADVRTHVRRSTSAATIGLMRAVLATWQEWDANRYDSALLELPRSLPVLAVQSTYVDRTAGRRFLSEGTSTTPYLDYLRTRIPRLEAHVLPGVGHFSMLEAADEVSRLIGAFAAAQAGA